MDQTMRSNCLTITLLEDITNHIYTHENHWEDVSPCAEVDDVPIPMIQPTQVNAPVSVELCHSQN